MKSFWRILKFARPYRLSAVLNVIFNLLATVFSLASIGLVIPVLGLIFNQAEAMTEAPAYDGNLVEYGKQFLEYEVGRRIAETGQSDALLYLCFLVIGAFFFKNLFRYLALFVIANMRNGITRDMRMALHRKFLQLPIGYFTNEKRKGDMISRMTSDLKELEWSLLTTLESFFRDPVVIIGSLVILLVMSPKLTVFVLILLPVVSIVITTIGNSLKKTSGRAQGLMGRILSQVEENLGGLKVIKAFNAAESKNAIFQRSADQYFAVMNRVLRKTDLASPLSEFMGVAVFAIIIWYGGGLVLSGDEFTAEEFIAYILFFYQVIAPAKSMSRVSYQVQRGNASGERVLEILDAENPIRDKPNALEMPEFSKEIYFNKVSFTYPEHDTRVLHELELRIPKGKTIALVGQSGSGKTTLTNLVPRFYDVTGGHLEIDGVDVRDLKIESLRAHLGIVTQESLLFNESVRYNITLGKPDATMEEIVRAARIANAHEFIEKLEQGYETNIGDGGSKLSGGQKQRLSIARAVLKNPPIMILDEATSALDTESEKLVQDALYKLMENRTSLVIAHRLSTIQHADEIIVMDAGRIAERGTHQDLLARKGIYSKLVEMQSFD